MKTLYSLKSKFRPQQFTFLLWGSKQAVSSSNSPGYRGSPPGGIACVLHVSTPSTSCTPQSCPSSSSGQLSCQWQPGRTWRRCRWRRTGPAQWSGCCWTAGCRRHRGLLSGFWRARSKPWQCFWWSAQNEEAGSCRGLKNDNRQTIYIL